jgi:hypothetical protein
MREAPSFAEVIDRARAILPLGGSSIDAAEPREGLAALLDHEEDREVDERSLDRFVAKKGRGRRTQADRGSLTRREAGRGVLLGGRPRDDARA